MATELGKAFVQIVPSARGISGSISRVMDPEAQSAGKSAGAKAGGGLVSTFKKVLVAAGLGKAIGAALTEGGDLEQSLGGVETLFKDNADTVKGYARDAYKTVGVSANEYMENVTGFSASLLQSMGGDTEKAADIAHMAMVDMADNANKMGTDMRDIQNAYQGFAKQNYTMLDNLKLGYGGTKKEMERLLSDAQELTGVKYDIENLDDIYNAIHAIQGEIGITGTTMEEAEETMQGSLKALKSSFKNVLGEMAIGGDVGGALEGLTETILTFVTDNLIPMLTRLLSQIPGILGDVLSKTLPKLTEAFLGMLAELARGFADSIPAFMENGVKLVDGLIKAIKKALPGLFDAGITMVSQIIFGLLDAIPQLVQIGAELISDFAGTLSDGSFLEDIYRVGGEIIDTIIRSIGDLLPTLIQAGADLMVGIVNGLSSAVQMLVGWGKEIVQALTTVIQESLPDIIATLVEMVPEVLDAIVAAITETLPVLIDGVMALVDGILELLPVIIDALLDAIVELVPAMVSVGVMLFTALVKALPTIIAAIVEVIPTIIDAILDTIDTLLPLLVDAGITLLTALVEELPTIIAAIVVVLPKIVQAIMRTLSELAPMIIDAGVKLLVALVEDLPTIIKQIVAVLPELITSMVRALVDNVGYLVDAGVTLLIALVENLPEIITGIVEVLPDIIIAIVETLIDNIGLLIQAGFDLFMGLIEALPQVIDTLASKMPEIIDALVKGIKEGVWRFVEAGKDLLGGLAEGIKKGMSAAVDSAREAAGGILNSVKNFFGIRSPSRVFAKIGRYLDEGLAGGIKDNMRPVMRAMDGLEAATSRNFESEIAIRANAYGVDSMQGLGRALDSGFNLNQPLGRQDLQLTLNLGKRAYKTFVEDITGEQDQAVELQLAYS